MSRTRNYDPWDVNARRYERKSNDDRSWIYLRKNSRRERYAVSKWKSPKVKPGRDLIGGTQITSRIYEFDFHRNGIFFFVFVERNRNRDMIDKLDRQLRET